VVGFQGEWGEGRRGYGCERYDDGGEPEGLLEEVGCRGEVGWEEVGLERGRGEVCVALWSGLFYHGVGGAVEAGVGGWEVLTLIRRLTD
jgi:hypothetical protein